MQNTLKRYGDWLLVRKGLGEITIKGYKATLAPVLKRLRTLNPSEEQIEKYIVWMYEKKYSYSHIRNTSFTIEWYFKFQGRKIQLGRPRKPKTIIKDTLSEAEITRLIDASKNSREKAIIALLAYSGIRNRSLCKLRVCDINLGDNMVRILGGKHKIDGLVYISGDCTRILLQYLNDSKKQPEEYLFTTLHKGNQYDPSDLRKLVKVLASRARIRKRTYPHLLRHSLATNLLQRNCPLQVIQKQLLHQSISSTEVYIRSFPQRHQAYYHLFIPSYI